MVNLLRGDHMPQSNILLVTGMSGAGKTSAMGILEDMGYHCIDQFPVQLLANLGDIIHDQPDSRYANIALATPAIDYPKYLNYFENSDANVRVIFLDASDEKLLLRYKFTRRHHPMILFQKANTLEEAIQVFSISFVSFGFKYGVPLDADLIFDMRFLPNPFYIDELKELTGDDQSVFDYVMACEETKRLLKHITHYLDFCFESYAKENKNHLTVGIGCTGGKHRSISVTNWLYEHYQKSYHCYKSHRDKKAR